MKLLPIFASLAFAFDKVSLPNIQFSDLGGSIGFLGSFDALSFYSYKNASSSLLGSDDSVSIYLRNVSDNANIKIGSVNDGDITQILPLGEDSVLLTGSFTSFNNKTYTPPLIYNVTTGEVTSIFSSNQKKDTIEGGSVKVAYVDGDLIYLGGDFEYNNTRGAAVYNSTSKKLRLLPFKGFGNDSMVNAITKLEPKSDDPNEGSIIFGGSFDTLGLPELLQLNMSSNSSRFNHSNSTNVSLISAEQKISLKHGEFTSINSDSDPKGIICPDSSSVWKLQPQSGGQWAVQLPAEMRGLSPTKVRLYLPDDADNGVKAFRIYTYPNNGIMNLTYVNPETNDLQYCDANCPLPKSNDLKQLVDENKDNGDVLMDDDDNVVVSEDGSFAMYYDDSTKSKNLGYGSNYMEFALVNDIAIDRVGVTVTDWYGNHGELSGFELYTNAISVYGNETLNESNCGDEELMSRNSATIDGGDWQSVQSLVDSVTNTDYLVSTGATVDTGITLYPNISYDGEYSILLWTPGCQADNSCSKRSIVNVSVIDTDLNVLEHKLIYQNNFGNKFDYLYFGHMNGSSNENRRNKIQIDFYRAIDESVSDPWMVVDRAVANIVSLDSYSEKNLSNRTSLQNRKKHDLQHIYLNGLFEYSLANFSSFSEDLVYTKKGDETFIKTTNKFVGNSSINELSGKLSGGSEVKQILLQNSTDSPSLLLLGDFSSKNVTLSNGNLLTLELKGYNETLNLTEASLKQRSFGKRDDEKIFGLTFNDSITRLHDFGDGFVALGAFSANSDSLKDLNKDNASISSANNFAMHSGSEWYSFGNSYVDADFDKLTNISVDGFNYYVFSANNEIYRVWDQSSSEFVERNYLNVSTAAELYSREQQVLGGNFFNIMDYHGLDEAVIRNNSAINSYGLNITRGDILTSFHGNSSFSVFGGTFFVNDTKSNLAFVKNNKTSTIENTKWDENTAVDYLYIDTDRDYLFIGTNGSVQAQNSNVTGLVLLHLSNESFAATQPADLSSDGGSLLVNAMVFYDDNDKLLVGGRFDNAGSLGCEAVCVYDVRNTRWETPSSEGIVGTVTDAKFFDTTSVLMSGNITINDTKVDFAIYDFSAGRFSAAPTQLQQVSEPDDYVKKFIVNEKNSQQLKSRMTAYGKKFIKAYNGSQWSDISEGVELNEQTIFTDMKLLLLQSKDDNRTTNFFDDNKILLVSGFFNLTNYGPVNAAFFDGESWIPYIYTLLHDNEFGIINLLLVKDTFSFQSSKDLKKGSNNFSKGQVVGVSLACAIGSTALIGLLYLIPMMYLFKKSDKEERMSQRIHEDEMMNVVDPEELFHEIDLQRHT